jgi:hypothetical protein
MAHNHSTSLDRILFIRSSVRLRLPINASHLKAFIPPRNFQTILVSHLVELVYYSRLFQLYLETLSLVVGFSCSRHSEGNLTTHRPPPHLCLRRSLRSWPFSFSQEVSHSPTRSPIQPHLATAQATTRPTPTPLGTVLSSTSANMSTPPTSP